MSCLSFSLADAAPASEAAGWITLGIIVTAGLLIGFGDMLPVAVSTDLALSGVCFTESMRRRVLLVTLLAIAGLVVVSQLQQGLRRSGRDPPDRQVLCVCQWNGRGHQLADPRVHQSPREIENRVIFTIVTKPTTRLEIVLGKILGFARVSAAILLIMGIFSYGYLEARSYLRVQDVRAQLATLPLDAPGLRDAGSLRRPRVSRTAQHGHGL